VIHDHHDQQGLSSLIMTYPNWTAEDQHAAQSEGWDIFQCDDKDSPFQLQILDDPESYEHAPKPFPFSSDPDAWLHVLELASKGSPLHMKALDFLGVHSPEENERITLYLPSIPPLT
jgi:hypothetical protein